jgi:hypothetical protein
MPMKTKSITFPMTPEQQAKKLLEILEQEGKDFQGNPEKARAFLIRMGILEKSGKRLVKRYRH